MTLKLCSSCLQHHLATDPHCPRCDGSANGSSKRTRAPSFPSLRVSTLLGLGMNVAVYGCVGGKYGMADSGFWDSGGTTTDMDGDGYNESVDCDDSNAAIHPGAAENELTDACTEDADGDGWGAQTPTGSGVTAGTDCDDTKAEVYPGATETAGDTVDSNCDGNDDT